VVGKKAVSKTGLSHVFGLGQFPRTNRYGPDSLRLLGVYWPVLRSPSIRNFVIGIHTILGAERVILAYQYLQRDIDLFARFAPLLLQSNLPLNKTTCRRLFVSGTSRLVRKMQTPRGTWHRIDNSNFRSSFETLSALRGKARSEIEDTSYRLAQSRLQG